MRNLTKITKVCAWHVDCAMHNILENSQVFGI